MARYIMPFFFLEALAINLIYNIDMEVFYFNSTLQGQTPHLTTRQINLQTFSTPEANKDLIVVINLVNGKTM
jgi:hypothetical protein